MQPYDLRCEYLKNPLGIDVPDPRFFWKLKAEGRGVMQKAWRIQVATDSSFRSVSWDSGEVQSAQSTHVVYAGPDLTGRTRYWWRVMAWDGAGRSDGWSDAAWFETGRMGGEWSARWIRFEDKANDESCPLLRREFVIDSPVNSARIYATAKGVYRLWLNGSAVGDWLMTPGWTDYRKRILYQTYDVTGLLNGGANAIGAMLGRGWYAGDLGQEMPAGGLLRELLLELHVRYEDGREQTVKTDSGWTAAPGPLLMSEIYHGETYDARLEIPGWCEPGHVKGNWRAVAVSQEHDFSSIVAQDGLPVRRIEEIKPKALLKKKGGETVLDMGQNIAGFLRFRVKGRAGDRVVLKHCEVLDREGGAYFANLRRARQTVEYTLKGGGEETFEPFFSYQGFRYAQITEWPGELNISQFTGVVVHSDMEPTGTFCCNEELVNRLQHSIVWGQKGNFLDVPTDCPQRDERHGWTGDAQVFMPTACFNFQAAPFYTKWLRDMAAGQWEDGGISVVTPAIWKGKTSSAWSDAATICPWTVYEYYGDERLLAECYPMMKRWVEHIRRQGDNEYLWNTGRHFGDWLGLDAGEGSYTGATDKALIATAYYALSASLLARAAAVLGYEDDANEYGKLFSHVRQAFQYQFVTKNGSLTCRTQTAQVLALRFGLLDAPSRGLAIQTLKDLLIERGGYISTGFVGTPHICHVLTDNGLHETACELIMKTDCPSWLYPVTRGATTMWEHWDGIKPDGSFWSPDMNSFNHYAYGSIGDWLYRNILGIAPDTSQPGFKHIIICPKPCGVFIEATGFLNTLYGEVAVAWKLSNIYLDIELNVPVNTLATVVLLDITANGISENGIPLNSIYGISDIMQTENGISFDAGSGVYKLRCILSIL